ncbi:DCC1-like thiol-disulfide oxidoreductase family protein [Haloglomus salinum]|jgi:predicted DCC family thiol-disulfide oxidoreductase YuxK|uniref:DCC1-like thiol-disulfide oxidoreductase family protein n=1 Tax=Haloglomus salinum TaxID=2962673 RepID=UPI0020C9CDC1|nr:DCC1-like thiol-disulfide oxidoreductase family protein [Haloglomus salinum]
MSDIRDASGDGPAWFVYDDDCGFCSWWAAVAAEHTDLGIIGFAALTDEERARLPGDYEDCAHLLTEDEVWSCGAAIEAVLGRLGVLPRELRLFLNQTADYGPVREKLYRAAADRRAWWGRFVSEAPPERREPQ